MKCACSGKKKSVKLRPLCPCEQHQPVSKTINGPKPGSRSLGCQCCTCEDSKLQGQATRLPMGQIEILGPAGGLAQMENGGVYVQAGLVKHSTTTETSTSPRKNCVCTGKKGKKKKNIICECPPPEPEPEPEPILEFYDTYQWIDQKQVLKQKSDMTQTHSGFKFFKKKKPPPVPEVEFTVEDAVRYYASMNPNLLRDLVPPPPEYRETHTEYKDCTCKGNKKANNDTECSCNDGEPLGDSGVGGFSVAGGPPLPPCPVEPIKDEEIPFRGLKLSMGGKGSGSKGLSGVCCFDMIQETNKSRSRRSND